MSAYYPGWLQAAVQGIVFFISLGALWDAPPWPELLLWSMAFGWSWFALLMVGHDAAHRTFSPWKRVDRVVAFFTLDCLLLSERCWRQVHQQLHHAHPLSAKDRMYLRGPTAASEMFQLAVTVVRYTCDDFVRLMHKPTWRDWTGAGVRFALLASLLPFALVPALFFFIVCGNYLGLLPHAASLADEHSDPVIRQLRTAWDFFPGSSFLAGLITGGLHAHATHHVFPHLPRGAHAQGARLLRDIAGEEYRSIEHIGDLVLLFRNRHTGMRAAPSTSRHAILATLAYRKHKPTASDSTHVAS